MNAHQRQVKHLEQVVEDSWDNVPEKMFKTYSDLP